LFDSGIGVVRQLESLPLVNPRIKEMLEQLIGASIVMEEDWEILPAQVQIKMEECPDVPGLLALLCGHNLLTQYQADRIEAGKTHGLMLGYYRVLERLGAGGMSVVFKAEHSIMRRLVAIKVIPFYFGQDRILVSRFLTEMRAVAQLQHPNIVAAIDAGEAPGQDPDSPVLHYFVMEYVPGQDLDEYVSSQGPLSVAKACGFAYQIASALDEAHSHNLVHRDIKPSNVRITPDEKAKLLDFGLARHFRHRQTEPGVILGTVDYMAPEQAKDSSAVDIRADIYALGGTLFWCLTGEVPFPANESLVRAVTRRLTQAAPSVRALRLEIPVELDAILSRMMALRPEDRYATPHAVMHALLPFLKHEFHETLLLTPHHVGSERQELSKTSPRAYHILVVDDETNIRRFCRSVLEIDGYLCTEAADGVSALEAVNADKFDVILLDIDMPNMNGMEVLRRLREHPSSSHLKVIMFSGRAPADEMAMMLVAGADGYLAKPFSLVQLSGQVKAAIRLKDLQDRADLLNRRLVGINGELENTLVARDSDLVHVRNALVLALAKLIKHRDGETGAHVWRLQQYCRCLAEAAASSPNYSDQIDKGFIDLLECCAPLHDIGKVGIPDHILLKPGSLTADERLLMQTHTLIGAETLTEVAEHHGSAVAFLQMAIDIARHHHERFDGAGYPDRLTGDDIPLAARIVAICDVYDALRSRRVYKPALTHATAVELMIQGSPGQFDPALIPVFERCADKFNKIFHQLA
jgi:response regulator RpfG family c-di-GMP phosphodiesterase/tRNA A-37 threonylcarbamoyl transferase component Bud32